MKWLRKLLQSRELQNTIKDSFVCPMLFAKKQAIFLVEFSDKQFFEDPKHVIDSKKIDLKSGRV